MGENHAVVKSVLLNVVRRKEYSWHLHLRYLLWVCSADAKMRTNGESARKHPESESFVRHWPAYAEFEMLSIPAKKSLACVRQNGGKRKIVNRCWWWCRRGRGAGLCTEVNSIPYLAHSLNCNHSTLIKCYQCPGGLKDESFWESWKG